MATSVRPGLLILFPANFASTPLAAQTPSSEAVLRSMACSTSCSFACSFACATSCSIARSTSWPTSQSLVYPARRWQWRKILPVAGFLLSIAGCSVMPTGPSTLVLPGTGKTFEQFRGDDYSCRGYAQGQVGSTADQARVDSGVRSAALGTLVGALAGAAMDGGHGAGVGAGTGLVFGTLAGAGAGEGAGYGIQQRYDFAYQQCMYANGHRVPVAGGMVSLAPSTPINPPANAAFPPPDTPPPPPVPIRR